MKKAGMKQLSGEQAHHIVARNAPLAALARKVLNDAGIDIDAAVNGVFLPANTKTQNSLCKAVHSTLHTIIYYEFVNESLAGAFAADGRDGVIAALEGIREMLKSGILEYGGED